MFKIILLLAASAWSLVDLVAPFTVDLLSTKGPIWDTIVVTTYVSNQGTSNTPIKTFDATVVIVGLDSFAVYSPLHRLPAYTTLPAGYFKTMRDTTVAPKGPFSISTWCDPLLAFYEEGYEVGNNVRSQAYNFHPKTLVFRDTVLIIDTLKVHDTLKIVQKDTIKMTLHDTLRISIRDTIFKKDTIRVTLRDTVIKKDTIKFCPPPPTLAKTSGRYLAPSVPSIVYNAIGEPVWNGMLREGEFPSVRLKQGLHVLVQGDKAHRFRVAYK